MKKVLLIPGVRFHSESYLDLYKSLPIKSKIYIATSSPKSKFKNKNFVYIFIPYFFKILFKIFNLSEGPYLKKFDQLIFSYLTVILVFFIKPDIVHSWGGISLKAFSFAFKKIKILERSSTFLPKQLDIIKNEYLNYNIPRNINENDLKIFYKELDLANYIIAPSNYVYNGYPDEYKKKIKIIYPFSSKLFKYSYKLYNTKDNIIGYVGGNLLVKGFFELYNKFLLLRSKNFKLWLKIDKSNLNIFGSHIKNQIIQNKNIKICGSSMPMEYFYSSIDVLMQPSIDDGFNMTTIEALSSGVPTYVSNNMGSKEFLEKILPKNVIKLGKENNLLEILKNLNKNNLIKDSENIKNNFKKIYDYYQIKNQSSFKDLILK